MGACITRLIARIAFLPPQRGFFDYWRTPASVSMIEVPIARVRVPVLFIANERARFTVLYSHGNAAHVVGMQSMARLLSEELPCNFAAYEYPGYSTTAWIDESRVDDVPPSETSTLEAAECALMWLIEERHIDPRTIVLYGTSLGTGCAVHLAWYCAQRTIPIGGLILQAPLASAFRVVFSWLWLTLPFDIFASIDKIGGVQCRIAMIHGTADKVVPIAHSRMLARAAQPHVLFKPLYVEGANHNDIETQATAAWLNYVREFFCTLVCE